MFDNTDCSRKLMLRLIMLLGTAIGGVLLLILAIRGMETAVAAPAAPNDLYGTRKSGLGVRASQNFVDDAFRAVETDLDKQPFDEINKLTCPKPVDKEHGWAMIMRTGGRPFLNFDEIVVDGELQTPAPCTKGDSSIDPIMISDHYDSGKTVNRIWFTHYVSSTHYPTVVVMTADGFFNVGGSDAPMLQGAANRMGFIGDPFTDDDFLQHVDEVNITFDETNDSVLIVYNIHSEVGEGVLEVELTWDDVAKKPVLHFRSAHQIRDNLSEDELVLGFAGYNFMRGPTLFGRISETGTPQGGIESYHDGRNVYLVNASGAITRSLLVPPVMTTTVAAQQLAENVANRSKLVLEQPQNVSGYFSEEPFESGYELRTDLVLTLTNGFTSVVQVKQAQKPVDLSLDNPEAHETVNVFYAAEMEKYHIHEFAYDLAPTAKSFAQMYAVWQQGVVFVSDREEGQPKLFYMPLDADFEPAGAAIPLTDGVISDVRRPAVSANGRFIMFDADTYEPKFPFKAQYQRVHTVSLATAAVRRLTADPDGGANDINGRFSGDGSHFILTTNRTGKYLLVTSTVATGLPQGTYPGMPVANHVDWCHGGDDIVYSSNDSNKGLWIKDTGTGAGTNLVDELNISTPSFSPDCSKIAYEQNGSLYRIGRDGGGETAVISGTYPTWIDDNHLLFHRDNGGNDDIYLWNFNTMTETLVITSSFNDYEAVFVPATPPKLAITSDEVHQCAVLYSGSLASSGVPTLTLNGIPAKIDGDRWSAFVSTPGLDPDITIKITDSATGLSVQETRSYSFTDCILYLPLLLKLP